MIQIPNCYKRRCIHYIGILQPNNDESIELPYCKAFPEGIPDSIAYGSNDHLTIRKDQVNEVVFEKKRRNRI